MANTNDNISKLHQALKNEGYNDIGSEDEFRTFVSSSDNVKKLHQSLKAAGYDDIGSEDEFDRWLKAADVPEGNAAVAQQQTGRDTVVGGTSAAEETRGKSPTGNTDADDSGKGILDRPFPDGAQAPQIQPLQAPQIQPQGWQPMAQAQDQGSYTFTESEMKAQDERPKSGVPGLDAGQAAESVGQQNQTAPSYGSEAWKKARVGDDSGSAVVVGNGRDGIATNVTLGEKNPYAGMTREEALNAVAKKFRDEWYGKPGAYSKIQEELANYGITNVGEYGKAVADIRNSYVAPVAKRRINEALKDFDKSDVQSLEDMQAVLDSREMQQAIKQDVENLGMENADAYYQALEQQLLNAAVEKFGYLPADDARSHARQFANTLMQGDARDHEDRILRREYEQQVGDHYADAIARALTKGDEKADAIMKAHNESVSPYSYTGTDFGVLRAARKANEERDPDKILDSLLKSVQEPGLLLTEDPKMLEKVWDDANAKGMNIDDYINTYVAPAIQSGIIKKFEEEVVKRELPQGTFDYVMRGLADDSVLGMIYNSITRTPAQIRYRDIANAQAGEDKGILTQGARLATGMASDFWLWGGWGKIGSAATGRLLSQRAAALAAREHITKEAAVRLLEEEGRQYLGKGIVDGMLRHIPQSAITMGGAEATSEAVRGITRDEEAAEIIKNTLGTAASGAVTGTAFGVTGGVMGRLTSQLSGAKRLAGKLAGLEAEAGTLYTTEELQKLASGEDAFQNPYEGLLEANVKLGFIKASANPLATGAKLMNAIAHPVKAVKGMMKPEMGVLDEDDVRDIRESFDGKALLDALTTMRPARSTDKGEREGYITEAQAAAGAEAYRNFMSNTERPMTRKLKVAKLLGGMLPPPGYEVRAEVVDGRDGIATDGTFLRTRDIDGQVIREQRYDSREEAEKAAADMQRELEDNATKALEERIDQTEVFDRFRRHFEDEYQKIAEKYASTDESVPGEEMSEREREYVYLHQHQNELLDAYQQISDGRDVGVDGEQLTQRFIELFEQFAKSGAVSEGFKRDFEYEHGYEEGAVDRAIENKERSAADEDLIVEYRQAMLERLGRARELESRRVAEEADAEEMRETADTGAGAEAGRSETRGDEAPVPPADAGEPETPLTEGGGSDNAATDGTGGEAAGTVAAPVRSERRQAAYERGTGVVDDLGRLPGINYEAQLTMGRLTQLMPDKDPVLGRLRRDVVKAVEAGDEAEVDRLISTNSGVLTDRMRDAIEQWRDVNESIKGIDDAIDAQVQQYATNRRAELQRQSSSDGSVTEIELTDGSRAHLLAGDVSNRYGGVMVIMANGETKQIPVSQVRSVGEKLNMEDLLRQEVNSYEQQLEAQYAGLAQGSAFVPGANVELMIGSYLMPMRYEGSDATGNMIFTEPDGKQSVFAPQDVQRAVMDANKSKVSAQLQEEDMTATMSQQRERFAKGIVGYSEGKPDYSAEGSDAKVVAEYLAGNSSDSRNGSNSVLKGIDGEVERLVQTIADGREAVRQAANKAAFVNGLDAVEQASAIQDRKAAEVRVADAEQRIRKWGEIRQELMSDDERTRFERERIKKISKAAAASRQSANDEAASMMQQSVTGQELMERFGEQRDAEAFVEEEQKRLRAQYRDELFPQLDGVRKRLADYRRGLAEYSDDELQALTGQLSMLEAEESRLKNASQELGKLSSSLRRLYAAKEKAQMSPREQKLAALSKETNRDKKLKLARQAYADDEEAASALDDMEPRDVYEWVASSLGRGAINWEGLQRGEHYVRGLRDELGKDKQRGLGRGSDTFGFNYFLAPEGKGKGIDEVVHDIAEGSPYDTQEVRNALLDMLASASKPTDISHRIVDDRIAQAEETYNANLERELEAENDAIREMTGMEPDEYDSYISSVEEDLAAQEGYRTSKEYFNQIAEDNDRENERRAGGGEEASTLAVQREESEPVAVASAAEGRAEEAGGVTLDKQGNPVDKDGKYILEKVDKIEDITDDDFTSPTRNVELPSIPENIDNAIGANGKPVIIKKNIFEKNAKAHQFSPSESRQILESALYNADLVGQTQPQTRKNHWVAIKIDDKSPITVLEVNQSKDNVEVVGWYTLDARNLERIKRQAEREDGELLILTPKGAAASLSTLPSSISAGKVTNNFSDGQGKTKKSSIQGLEDYSEAEILDYVREFFDAVRGDNDADAEIVDMKIIGSRTTGTAKPGSDLDVLLEYKGGEREDDLFDMLNGGDETLVIDGISVDINPITAGKSGTIQTFLERNAEYRKEPATFSARLADAKKEVNASPTEAQKEAGNYKKGHLSFGGYEYTIENPKGSVRSGIDANGRPWEQEMKDTYGYIRGKYGTDGDHIDMFINDNADLDSWNGRVFIVDQKKEDGSYDEHKVMYGYKNWTEAKRAYERNYEKGWWDNHVMQMMGVKKEDFDKWLADSDHKRKPFADYFRTKMLDDVIKDPVDQMLSDVAERRDVIATDKAKEDTRKRIEQQEIGGAMVDRLEVMGMDVSTDPGENRRARKIAEKDQSEAGKMRHFETSDGKVYGFVYKGKLYLDPTKIDAELPIHEYAHPWCEAIRRINPENWKRIVDLMRGDKDTWDFVKQLNPDLKNDDDIAEEMIAKYSGRRGAERAKAEFERMNGRDADYKSKWNNIWKNISKAIQDFWKQVGDFLNLKYESAEQVFDQVVKDFANKINPVKRVEEWLQQRDDAYLKAVEEGDEVKVRKLFDDALRENIGNGITPFVAVSGYRGKAQKLAHGVKSRDPEVIAEVADLMAPLIPKDAVLVPAPSHSGKATDMLDVAQAISERTGAPIADVLRSSERGSQYEAKKGGRAIASKDMGITMEGELPDGKLPVVIDNVVDTGNTAEACVQALGRAIVASLADSADRYKHVASLKSAEPVVTDKNGKVVPLSKRFELGGRYLEKADAVNDMAMESDANDMAMDASIVSMPRINQFGFNESDPIGRTLTGIKQANGENTLAGYFDADGKTYLFMGKDAGAVRRDAYTKGTLEMVNGVEKLSVPKTELDVVLPILVRKGYKVGIADTVSDTLQGKPAGTIKIHASRVKSIVQGELFSDKDFEDAGKTKARTVPTQPKGVSSMSDEELLKAIGENEEKERGFHIDEYDKRHRQEYNEVMDAYSQMLEENNTSLDDAYSMYADTKKQWADNGGYATPERTQLQAQIDALEAYIEQKEAERMEREAEEEDAAATLLQQSEQEAEQQYQQQKEEVRAQGYDLTQLKLRPLKPGETSHVERRYQETGMFSFTGGEYIESIDDVAFIFKELEDAAVENTFMVLEKDGVPTIIHLAIGNYNAAHAPFELALAAVQAINPDKVYFVHNHPSGNLKSSRQDRELMKRFHRVFGDKLQDGIIIDTKSGKYGVFYEVSDLAEREVPTKEDAATVPMKVYSFSKQVFASDWNPEEAFTATSAKAVAEFVSSHRLGEHKKMSLIVMDQAGHVTGNVFLPWTAIKDAATPEGADLIASYVNQMGGNRVVIYGNYEFKAGQGEKNAIERLNNMLKNRNVSTQDIIHIDRSAYDMGDIVMESSPMTEARDAVDMMLDEVERRKGLTDKGEADVILKQFFSTKPKDEESQARQRATQAVLKAMDKAGVPYEVVSKDQERKMLTVFAQMNQDAVKEFCRRPDIRAMAPHGSGRYAVYNVEDPFGVPMYAEKQSVARWIKQGVQKYGGKWEILDIGWGDEDVTRPVVLKTAAEVDGEVVQFMLTGDNTSETTTAPVFVSNALKAVEGMKQEKATPEQWLAMIQKAGGLKAGEDKWMGLSDWLTQRKTAGHGGSVTKQEVLDYIRENQIQVEDVNYSGVNRARQDEDYESLSVESLPEVMREPMKALNERWKTLYQEARKDADSPAQARNAAFVQLREEYGSGFGIYFATRGAEQLVVRNPSYLQEAAKMLGVEVDIDNPINSTRLNYTTEGLQNKREIALVVPTVEAWNASDDVHFGDAGNGRAVAWVRFGDAYVPNMGGDPNDLASGVSKVLVIDEIQSKRHQEGREKGYKPTEEQNKREIEEANKALDAAWEELHSYSMNLKDNGKSYKNASAEERAELERLTKTWEDAIQLVEKKKRALHTSELVPDAPFEKNWHELAMKRMLRYAAENGYDKIAWTKGEQQADRYSIGGVAKDIQSYDLKEGGQHVMVHLKGGNAIIFNIDDNGSVTRADNYGYVKEGQPLSDIVGKELATKIVNREGKKVVPDWAADMDRDVREISGDNLRIGGEGMKGFYDQMLPRFMDKYGKKWGVKTGEIELPDLEPSARRMWSVDVTPEMKESVMQGQPMFQKEGKKILGWSDSKGVHLTEAGLNPNTPIHECTHMWDRWCMKEQPELWKTLVAAMKKTAMWEQIRKDANYRNIWEDEDRMASEVHSRLSGAVSEEEFMKAAFKKGTPQKIINEVKSVLRKFWEALLRLFGKQTKTNGSDWNSLDAIVRMPLRDLLNQDFEKVMRVVENYADGMVEGSIVTDKAEIERLNNEPTEKGYRNVVMNEDGTLGSPMGSKLGKKGVGRKATSLFEFGKWERSDENPDLATDDGKIDLIKPDGKTVEGVDYNPYIHIRPDKVNKQFKQAWERPNLIYVETEYPSSELKGEYKAEKAAKSVGKHPWGGGELILSRWDKPVRMVPWGEVADDWMKAFEGRGVEFDIVPPKLLPILAERGVEILPPHKGMGKACNEAYEEWVATQIPEQDSPTRSLSQQTGRDAVNRMLDEVDRRMGRSRAGEQEEQIRFQKKRDEDSKLDFDTIKPIGTNRFGKIYDQFKGKVKEAFDFLKKKEDGYLKGVFHRDDLGDIDLAWGSAPTEYTGKGLAHIIRKHIMVMKDFKDLDEAMRIIEDVINNGELKKNKDPQLVNIENGDYRVVVAKNAEGNWILSAFDYVTSKKEKEKRKTLPPSKTPGQPDVEAGAVTSNLSISEDKGTNNFFNDQEKSEKVAITSQQTGRNSALYRHTTPEVDRRNDRFNEELDRQINDPDFPANHIYNLGKPSTILLSTGFPNDDIELSASHLKEKSEAAHHPFQLNDVKDLVKAINSPIAVFTYGDKGKSQNVIAELQKEGKNFVVGIHFNQSRHGMVVSDIRGLYPKDNAEWLNWITQGKLLYADQEKIQNLIAQQRRTLAEVSYLDLNSVAKLLKDFENPKLSAEKLQELFQKAGGDAEAPGEYDVAVRDKLIEDYLKPAGIEVITDVAEGEADATGDAKLSKAQKRAMETASVPHVEKHQHAVISFAAGAKVRNNLETLAQNLEKVSNQRKNFIQEVAVALDATAAGSSSEYATFETKTGKIVTIRLADHNATVSNFDLKGEFDGISIVVTPKKNQRVNNDGNAHIVEYYYDSIKLRKADGKPLSDIVKSIVQVMYSGEYKDTTGLAEREEVNAPKKFFKTSGGEVYGYVLDGKIYIDPRIARADTPIHEYGHLWAAAIRKVNPEEWKNIVRLMKGVKDVWRAVERDYAELKTEDDIAEEVLAQYSGQRGRERFEREKMRVESDPSMTGDEKLRLWQVFENIKKALHAFWNRVADFLHIRYVSAEQVADQVLGDLLSGVNPTREAKKYATESGRIKAEAERAGTFMLAPDGSRSKLSEKQWVAVRTKDFKKWLGGDWEQPNSGVDSKLDRNGEPLEKYVTGYLERPRKPGKPKKKGSESLSDYLSRLLLWERAVKEWPETEAQWKAVVAAHDDKQLPDEEAIQEKWQRKYDEDLAQWKVENGLPADAEPPKEQPMASVTTDPLEYVRVMADWRRREALWQTAPMKEDYERQAETEVYTLLADMELKRHPLSYSARMQQVGASLKQLRDAVGRQRRYDQTTVKAVVDFAKNFMTLGFGDNAGRGDIEKILTSVKRAVGARNIRDSVDGIIQTLVENHLRNLSNFLEKLTSVKDKRLNPTGVEVQGELDLQGQRSMAEFRRLRSSGKSVEEITARMNELADKMDDDPENIGQWEAEYDGAHAALTYAEGIKANQAACNDAENAIRDAVKEYSKSGRSYEAQQQMLEGLHKGLEDLLFERIALYGQLFDELGGLLGESRERAKAFREKEKKRVFDIHRMAAIDMSGMDANETRKDGWKQKLNNSSVVRLPLGSLSTFEQFMKLFGRRFPNGEGRLYDHYMRGFVDAVNAEQEGREAAHAMLDAKAKAIFGKKRWSDLYGVVARLPKAEVSWLDGDGVRHEYTLTQGNMLCIYMWDKMSDGRMKLRKMGIEEDDVQRVKDFLDPRLVELADWVQEEFLPTLRTKYNRVHEEEFGASMAEIQNYFPLRILKDAIQKEDDLTADPNADSVLPATTTGSIIKRTVNSLPLDILNTDALSLVIEHVDEMEKWAAFTHWNKDVNTLLSYNRFQNQVKNMDVAYGSSGKLWDAFRACCQIAAGSYRPKHGPADKAMTAIASGVTGAKIAFRMFTAIKQLLSLPAILPEVNPRYLFMYGHPLSPAFWYQNVKWANENLPILRKRWKSRDAGDTRLSDDALFGRRYTQLRQWVGKWGMSPNAAVDFVTCAAIARGAYLTKLDRYLKQGFDEVRAKKRALEDAAIVYNLTQQSSEGAMVSQIQKDRTFFAIAWTVFRNSPMSYTRQSVDALRTLRRMMGHREEFIRNQARMLMEEGLNEGQAKVAARADFRCSVWKNMAKLLVCAFVLPLLWELGGKVGYLLLGDDDERKRRLWDDTWHKELFVGPFEGLVGGNAMNTLWGLASDRSVVDALTNEGLQEAMKAALKNVSSAEIEPLPLMADMGKMIEKFGYDKAAALQDMVNIAVQMGTGVNPATITDPIIAAIDASRGDLGTAKETMLLMLRVLQFPSSVTDELYIDELGVTADLAREMSYDEMAQRYAAYKLGKNAPFFGWTYNDEEEEKRRESYMKRFDQKVQERMGALRDRLVIDLDLGLHGDSVFRAKTMKELEKRMEGMSDEDLRYIVDNVYDRHGSGVPAEERQMVGRELARRMGFEKPGEGDTFMKYRNSSKDKQKRRSANAYVMMREWDDIVEDLELEKLLREANATGDDDSKATAEAAKKKMREVIYDLGNDSRVVRRYMQPDSIVDEKGRWSEIRRIRREALEKLRKAKE